MWLHIPEGKPIWQVKILQRASHYQDNDQTKTIQTSVKTMHRESHWQENTNWLNFEIEKGFQKDFSNLAVG